MKPQRLQQIFPAYDPPVYFVTFCTSGRRDLLANDRVCGAFREYAQAGAVRGVAVGRYVIMPDHVHLFVRGGPCFSLSQWVKGLKRAVSAQAGFRQAWEPGFFDHVMRNGESYAQKWEYVRGNPVRRGLVGRPEDWPFQGEIVSIDRVRM